MITAHTLIEQKNDSYTCQRLKLRTFIGFKPHEKKHKQDVLIQLEVEVETSMVEHNDDYQAEDFMTTGP